MRTTTFSILATLLLTLLGAGCTTTSNPTEPPATSKNDVHGQVVILDEYRNVRANRSGAIVTMASATWTRSDTTDALGKWHIYDAPAGVYTISATRDSCDTSAARSMTYTGSDSLAVPALHLTMPLSLNMITSATFDVQTKYTTRTVDSTLRTDTTLVIKFTATTPCRNDTVRFRWDVYGSMTEDCSAYDISGGDMFIPPTGVLRYERFLTYADLHSHFGPVLVGKKLYIQLRCELRVPKTTSNPKGCYPATVYEFSL